MLWREVRQAVNIGAGNEKKLLVQKSDIPSLEDIVLGTKRKASDDKRKRQTIKRNSTSQVELY